MRSMLRILLATFAGATTAVVVITIIAVFVWPLVGGRENTISVAVHFVVFGTAIAFPIAFIGGIPLYYFFKRRGWLTPGSVLAGGVGLSLVFPLHTSLQNPPGFVSFWHFCICAIAGVAASTVFIRISRLSGPQPQTGIKGEQCMKLPDDVTRFVERSFSPEHLEEALSILSQAKIEDGTTPDPRLLRCAAFASHGSLPRLRRLASMLAIDWRDVVMAGEYELRDKTTVQVRDLSRPL